MAMSTQSKLNHCQKHDGVKIHENLSFFNKKSKCTTFSIKPVFTVIYLAGYAIYCIRVKMFYTERINYVNLILNICNSSIYVLDNKSTIGMLEYIPNSKKVDKTDVVTTIHDRC